MTPVYAGWPVFADDEIAAVVRVLNSGRVNYWTGEEGRTFEREFAAYVGTEYAVALANGSVGLELALHALGLGRGDEVIVTPRTFIASASSIVLAGATPVFADVDRNSQNLTVDSIRDCISERTRAIIAVHLAGWPCDMDAIRELAAEHELRVIEDCAQAHGAVYRGCKVGCLGDVAVFSFCQDKIITTGGEGGMLVTDSEALWRRAWAYKDHGKSHATVYSGESPSGQTFRWLHESFGTNWRMTEMQAAIGRVQLGKLDEWVERRRANAAVLASRLAAIPGLRVPLPDSAYRHAYYKFYAFVRPERLRPGWDRDRIIAAVYAAGVPCYSGSCSEVYREKAFTDAGLAPPRYLPVARELGETSLMFLVHPTLTPADLTRMAGAVEQVLAQALD